MLWLGCADAGAGTAGKGQSTEERSASMRNRRPIYQIGCVEQGLMLGVGTHKNIGIYHIQHVYTQLYAWTLINLSHSENFSIAQTWAHSIK